MSDPTAPPPPFAGFPAPPPLEPSNPPAPREDTNPFAIAAIATALVGLLCGGSVLGLVFGIVALKQIRRTGQRGRVMAVNGVVIGALQVVAGLAFIAWGLSTELRDDDLRNDSGEITEAGDVALDELRAGDCLNGLNIDEPELISELPAVPCAQPHQGEVIAIIDLPDGDWPGQETIAEQAGQGCDGRIATFALANGDPFVGVRVIPPTRLTWQDGDRRVICLAYHLDGERAGSVRG